MKQYAGKLFLILFPIIAAIIMLWPTFNYYANLKPIENDYKARIEEEKDPTKKLEIEDKFKKSYGEEIKSAKVKALKLGLDLLGGMYVTLEVDVVKLIHESAQREAIDDTFLDVIKATEKEAAESEEPTLDIFLKNFDAIARPKGKSLISYFDIGDIKNASEDKIVEKLNDNASSAIDQAMEVIRQRIDGLGVSEANIQKQGARRIMLELPGVENEAQIRELLQTTARLEFKLVRNNADIVRAFRKIDAFLAQEYKRKKAVAGKKADTTSAAPETIKDSVKNTLAANEQLTPGDIAGGKAGKDTSAVNDTTAAAPDTTNPYEGLEDEEIKRRYAIDHQFTRLFVTYYNPGPDQSPVQIDYVRDVPDGTYFFQIMKDSIDRLNAYLDRSEIMQMIPYNLEIVIGAKPDKRILKQSGVEIFNLYSLKRDPELTGDVITDARASYSQQTNEPVVYMWMSSDGSDAWARITGANIDKRIAIDLDGRVYSAPVVRNKITGGSSVIEGIGDLVEARLLEVVLKAGALKAPVRIIQERVVGPSLGEDSIADGVMSSYIAVLLVILFMFLYYSTGGLVADFAVILNVILVVAVLSGFNGTLTLPGIAGLILTIGMAVDANVLIFERIREELSKGRSLRSAVDEGFTKALSAILDSNITTFITGLILFYFGSGPIKGFATTLMIGILGTLFTGILISRAIIEISILRGIKSFSFGQPKILES